MDLRRVLHGEQEFRFHGRAASGRQARGRAPDRVGHLEAGPPRGADEVAHIISDFTNEAESSSPRPLHNDRDGSAGSARRRTAASPQHSGRSPGRTSSATRARAATSTRSTTTSRSLATRLPRVLSVGMLQAGYLATYCVDSSGRERARNSRPLPRHRGAWRRTRRRAGTVAAAEEAAESARPPSHRGVPRAAVRRHGA